uniref:Uncharacterized protein n=1 Tax=Utricularia reniformis TaxID=192314 RepID=A0A1Y0AZC0_9LAMI|nr:hypothetical protein AEK19_MT0199 [Utricularia reniformis]ART30479.1 hypothetical protein AEK19_MT0199 [Utricularia reniformis]
MLEGLGHFSFNESLTPMPTTTRVWYRVSFLHRFASVCKASLLLSKNSIS